LYDFGIHRPTWANVPVYMVFMLFFPLVAMADAFPPAVRLVILRFIGPTALAAVGVVALMLRLPTAEGTPGKLVWTVMGTDTVTNLQVMTYSATVIAVLLAEGLLRAWVFPNELAFIGASLRLRVTGRGAVAADGVAIAPAIDEGPDLHDIIDIPAGLAHKTAGLTLPSAPRRSGSSVHPAQIESALVQVMSEAESAVESSRFTSVVAATIALSGHLTALQALSMVHLPAGTHRSAHGGV
jgi:hypothetical protein